MATWYKIEGTQSSYFRIGMSGVRLKNSTGVLQVRNAADSAFPEVQASKATLSGADLVLNNATNALTISANSSMSGALQIIAPADKSTDGYVLAQKSGTSSGVLEFELVAPASGSSIVDTTTLGFGSSSPVAMFTKPDTAVIDYIKVVIDTAFDGTPTASVGISGTTSKYLSSSDIDLTATAGTSYIIPVNEAAASGEDLIITYSAGSATAGSARFIVNYAVPV